MMKYRHYHEYIESRNTPEPEPEGLPGIWGAILNMRVISIILGVLTLFLIIHLWMEKNIGLSTQKITISNSVKEKNKRRLNSVFQKSSKKTMQNNKVAVHNGTPSAQRPPGWEQPQPRRQRDKSKGA